MGLCDPLSANICEGADVVAGCQSEMLSDGAAFILGRDIAPVLADACAAEPVKFRPHTVHSSAGTEDQVDDIGGAAGDN